MRLTDMISKKRFAPASRDAVGPPPERGAGRLLFLLSTHFWRLVELNLLFLVFCIPVVTIPASICGMNRVLIKLVRDGNCFLWSDFIGEFKASVFKSLPFGLLFAFLILDGLYAFFAGAAGEVFSLPPTAIGLVLLGFTAVLSGYVFVLMPALDLKNRHIAKNAFILMMSEWKTNLIILGITLAALFIALGLFPYGLFLLLFIWFSLSQMIVCLSVNEPMQRRIIGPYEKSRDDAKQ